MSEKTFLGEFEQMVLLAILRIEDDAYAVPIRREIEEKAERNVSRGALYTTLERLEAKGFVQSCMGDPTPERGGRSRRTYTVAAPGLEALENSRAAMANLWQGLDSVTDESP
jgi:DNA-binding PadR family transcriptional regulator